MKRLFVALCALSFAFIVTGCGQSGPLYIPGNPSKIENPPPPPDENEEEKEEDSDNDKN